MKKLLVSLILVFLFFAGSFGLIYLTTDRFISLDDQFFHIRFAEIIKERGLDAFRDFKWLYFSKIAQDQTYFENYHFLFYLTLLPFTLVNPLYLGIKFYGLVFGALAFSLLYFVLRRLEVKYSFFWTVFTIAAVSTRYLLRFLNARPLTLAPALLLLLVYFLYRKKYKQAFLISLFYFYWHSATFIFPLVVAVTYFVINRAAEKKFEWNQILFPTLGIVLAYSSMTALAPGFFQFMKDVTFNVIYRIIIPGQEAIVEGTELYPVDYLSFIRPNIIILILLIIAWAGEWYAFRARQKNTADPESNRNPATLRLTLLTLTLIFLIGTFLVRRNSDYFIFFAGTYLAVAVSFLFTKIQFSDSSLKKILTGGVLVTLTFLLIDNLVTSRYFISQARPHELIAPTAEWLKTNVPKGDVVFNASRDDFPTLFYYNPDNNYVVGLEARFLYDYSPRLYWLWWHISNDGLTCEQAVCAELPSDGKKGAIAGQTIAQTLIRDFQTKHVVSTPQFPKLNKALSQSPLFKPVYHDQYYVIYEVMQPS